MAVPTPLTLASINVASIKSDAARYAAFDFLGRVEADILFLQVTMLYTLAEVSRARREWRRGPSYWSLAAEPYSGVAVLFTAPVECRRFIELEMGRCLVLDVSMKGQELRLINIYGPQSKWDRKSLFMEIKPTIVSDARLEDLHIRQSPGTRGFTYFRGSCRSRIDRFFLKENSVATAVSVVEVEFSDHCLISFTLNAAETIQRGKGLWRLNSTLLEDPAVRQAFEEFLQDQVALLDLGSKSEWWEVFKERVAVFFRQLSSLRSLDMYRMYTDLRKKLEILVSTGGSHEEITGVKALLRRCQYDRHKSLVLERD
ncbi:uncharacterized protein RB166_021447 [Leptodactylus fuscus]